MEEIYFETYVANISMLNGSWMAPIYIGRTHKNNRVTTLVADRPADVAGGYSVVYDHVPISRAHGNC